MGNCLTKLKNNKVTHIDHDVSEEEKGCERDPVFDLLNENESFSEAACLVSKDGVRHLKNPFSKVDKKCIVHIVPDDTSLDQVLPELLPPPEIRITLPEHFPYFLGNFINREDGFKLKLEIGALPLSLPTMLKIDEVKFLLSRLKYLRLWYLHKVGLNTPIVSLEEDLGRHRNKGLRINRKRHQHVRFVTFKNTEWLTLIGRGFMLRLVPPSESIYPQYYDSNGNNGEVPAAMGTYTRMLNSEPELCLEWNVTVWNWENQNPRENN